MCAFKLAVFLLLCLTTNVKGNGQPPHIIVIIADDLGWNDVSFHGSNQIPTPNIDALAYNGIILNSHYVQPLCTPSRAAFLTGKYPIHNGMQHLVVLEPEPRGLPLTEKLLPEYLKGVGYATHAVGKWHLGFYRTEYTPTKRGFDSHYGCWNGLMDYYDHTVHATFLGDMQGYDFRRDLDVDYDARGKYSTHLFTDEASRIIGGHNTSSPLFLYLAHTAPHTGNIREPFQAPDEEVAKFSHIADPERRTYAAMVSVLDQGVGRVVTALRNKGMLENSIILFMSDNGGPTVGIHSNRASNYPLRGQKESPWEGGTRGVAAIWSPLLKNSNRVSNQLMHISDWLPTFWTAAGRDVGELGKIDGINMWESLKENTPSARSDLVINLDSIESYVAVRRGDWKYLNGSAHKGQYDQWYGDAGALAEPYDPKAILASPTSVSLSGYITQRQIREKNENGGSKYSMELVKIGKILSMRNEATVNCDVLPENSVKISCNPLEAPCIFNIKDDPCEMINLAGTRPLIQASLEEYLDKYVKSSLPPANVNMDLNADPKKYGNVWISWKDDNISVRTVFNSLSNTVIIAFGVFCAVACVSIIIVLFVTMKRTNGFGSVRRSRATRTSRLPRSLDAEKRRSHTREPVIVPPVSVAQRVEMFEEREHSI